MGNQAWLDSTTKRLTVSVPHLIKALKAAFKSFESASNAAEQTNFPLRFQIAVGPTAAHRTGIAYVFLSHQSIVAGEQLLTPA